MVSMDASVVQVASSDHGSITEVWNKVERHDVISGDNGTWVVWLW
jgi:hypothetical protein